MRITVVALGLLALAFACAEAVRPTRFPGKKIAARALLLRSQALPGGATGTLDAELLDDLPRIHPDADGNARAERVAATLALAGDVREPGTARAGAAVFAIVDGRRDGAERTTYGTPPDSPAYRLELDSKGLGSGPHRVAIGLISADQRGFFLLGNGVIVRVGR